MKKFFICCSLLLLSVSCKDEKSGAGTFPGNQISFAGSMPAAVGKGVSCTLDLNTEVVDDDTLFVLVQTLLAGGKNGGDITRSTQGTQHYEVRMHEGEEKTYLKLMPNDGSVEILFRVVNDSLLRMVRDDYNEFSDTHHYNFKRVY